MGDPLTLSDWSIHTSDLASQHTPACHREHAQDSGSDGRAQKTRTPVRVWFGMLKPGAHPRVGNPEVTGIPQVDSSTRQRQLISTHAEVTYLTKPPITTKPVVRTN